jgi:hypothetical protein
LELGPGNGLLWVTCPVPPCCAANVERCPALHRDFSERGKKRNLSTDVWIAWKKEKFFPNEVPLFTIFGRQNVIAEN